MPNPTITAVPLMAAGNRSQVTLVGKSDRIAMAKRRWNNELATAGNRPAGADQPRDGVPYLVPGAAQPFCWPHLRVAWRAGFQRGPLVQFQHRDDGLHLSVTFEEDAGQRVAGCLPLDVKIRSIRLVYGSDPRDVLVFADPQVEPGDPAQGPAFTVEADAPVPLDDRRARLAAALQARDAARWEVEAEFEWVRTVTPPPPSEPPAPPPPGGRPPGRPPPGRPGRIPPIDRIPIRMQAVAAPRTVVASSAVVVTPPVAAVRNVVVTPPVVTAAQPVNVVMAAPATFASQSVFSPQLRAVLNFENRAHLYHVLLDAQTTPAAPVPTTEVHAIHFTRTLRAEYPKDAPENRPIYAAYTGEYLQLGWRNSSDGWFQPTPMQDTVYCLPDAYRLQVDPVSGSPSIQAILLRKEGAGALVDSLDPTQYTVRLTLRARPDFDAEKLNGLRTRIRGESSNTVPFADLVFGGYTGARFLPDPALAGLGKLFAGSDASATAAFNPEDGFTVTYEGNAEFIDLLFQRLRGEGITGSVELDLQGPGEAGTVHKHTVPMVLTLRQPAALPLPWSFLPTPAGEDGVEPLPRDISLHNPTSVEVDLSNIQAHALQKSSVTGRVEAWYRARPDGQWPRRLAPGATETVRFAVDGDPLYNAWEISQVGSQPRPSSELVLNQLFDAATFGVRGWSVAVECIPFSRFADLTPEQQASVKDVVGLEVEIRRLGSSVVEEVRLSRQAPTGTVLLSRTVADFVSDRANGRTSFEYRQRILRLTQADPWQAWRPDSGSVLNVYLA
jgi:hypothetical protein